MVTKQWNGLPRWGDVVRGKLEREVMHACQSDVGERQRWVQYGRVVSHVDGTLRWASGEAGIVFYPS